MSRLGSVVGRALRLVRLGWDILGVVLLLLVPATGLVLGLKRSDSRAEEERPWARHPQSAEGWVFEYGREFVASRAMRWAPYVYWQRQAFNGRHIRVDSAGYRFTVQPSGPADRGRRGVFLFGGSTMWGTWQRDSATIPSRLAAALGRRGLTDVVVRNFGETGYVFTQEVLRLMLELRAGQRPAVVVFYDGVNDAAAAVQNGRCGEPQNEAHRVFEFGLGRALATRSLRDARDAFARARARADGLSTAPAIRSRADEDAPAIQAMGRDVVACYASTARIVEALAQAYGFVALYVWQPRPSASPKRLTPSEVLALDTLGMGGLKPYLRAFGRVTAREFDAAMAAVAPGRAINLASLFAGDTTAVWLDWIGHTTEPAADRIAQAMLEPVVAALATAAARRVSAVR